MKNVLARHALRYFAAAQVGPVVILQGVWMILATATWSHAYGADSGVAEAMRALMRGYAWLGGTDEFGRGNGNTLLLVWGKLSLVLYLIDAALRALRGPRPAKPRRSVWWWAGLSGLATLLVMGVALWPTQDSLLALTPLMLLFSALSAGAAAWAVLTRRLVERWPTPEKET
ncbi:MAG: hypothetical protein ABIO61_07085, partial [Thermomonas sp.]